MIAKNTKIRKRENYHPIIFSVVIGILTVGLIAFIIFANIKINQKRGEMMDKVESLNKQIKTLEEEKKKLEAGIGQAQSEVYWEGKVREQGYEMPGEETVVVLPPEGKTGASSTEQKSFWEKIREKLGF